LCSDVTEDHNAMLFWLSIIGSGLDIRSYQLLKPRVGKISSNYSVIYCWSPIVLLNKPLILG